MLLEKLTPLREFDLMDRRTRRIFEDLGFVSALAPAADVYETESELVVELEVPGFDESELTVKIVDRTLTIKGERAEESEREEATLRLRERLESQFERHFVLPSEIDEEHVTATYEKGVLTLRVPKPVEQKPITVPIEHR